MRATRYGRPLPDGGCIGVPATSTPWYNRSEVLRSVEWWRSRGYRVKLGDSVWERTDHLAGDPKTRARDVAAMFADPEVDVVQCLQGGYGAAQILPSLDFEAIAEHPKPFVGYSDITALHVAILKETGLATFYGPGFLGMGDPQRGDWSRDRLLRVLRGETTGPVPRDPDDPYVRTIRGGRVTAPIVGGCLWLLQHAVGTPWQPDLEGCILFIEEVDTPTTHLEAHLVHLRQAGLLDGVVGVVVGHMEKCDWREDRPEWARVPSLEDVLEQQLEPLGVPVLYKLPLGHGKHLATLPLGVTATLDADGGTLTIDEPAIRPGPYT
ncbi:MAG TPA: LD-carboxypeptidase [Actinomycetota bacterium]|nr:LD-carboxypeptidase [Actinomycetota bacterium]